MAFDTLTPRMQEVAKAGLKHFKDHYGQNGLRIGEEIDPNINWKPTYFVRRTNFLIAAAEVSEKLYPEILKIAAHDIKHFNFPIAVNVICPLEVFQADPKQMVTNQLKKHGFGIITVDDNGNAVQQHPCIPLAQHISSEELEGELRGMKPNLRVNFRSAHETYVASEGQGLQECGQIVESMVDQIAKAAVRRNLVGNGILSKSAADKIDDLYALADFEDHRAALGGARQFIKTYRNIASHAPKTPKKAIDKIRRCRSGFIEAIRTTKNLCAVGGAKGFKLTVIVT